MAMEILDSPLMGAFIAYVTANWSRRSRVDQSRRRLRHLVAMVRAVAEDRAAGRAAVRDGSLSTWLHLLRAEALRGQQVLDAAAGSEGSGRDAASVAGPARRFLTGLRTLFAGSDEVDRLTDAVEELERLAAPGADLDRFINVFGRRRHGAQAIDMDVDASPVADGRYRGEARGSRSAESVVAGAELPAPGAKRKRACNSCVYHGSASHAGVDTGKPQKRRVMPLMRLPADSGGRRFTEPPLPPGFSPEDRTRTVELAMARVRRRIGEPTRQRRQAILGEHFSRFSL